MLSDLNNINHWHRLILFPKCCLCVPSGRGGKKGHANLATEVNEMISSYESLDPVAMLQLLIWLVGLNNPIESHLMIFLQDVYLRKLKMATIMDQYNK